MKKLFFILVCCIILLSCSANSPIYPPPVDLKQADIQRHKFVDIFLQGNWNLAQDLFSRSSLNYIRQDNFCAVAQNFIIAYKLLKYINIQRNNLLESALKFSRQCLNCNKLSIDSNGKLIPSSIDLKYTQLIQQGQIDKLLILLDKEQNPLISSVYYRKIIQAARLSSEKSLEILKKCRKIDANQGWIIFIIQDWKLAIKFSAERQKIVKRINILKSLIVPSKQPFGQLPAQAVRDIKQ